MISITTRTLRNSSLFSVLTGLKAYPYIEPEDIDEALRYAACLAEENPKLWNA
jgi:hypothetical protein